MMQYTAFLSTEEVEKVHDTSLEILGNIGVQVHLEKARDIFAKHGCKVDPNSKIVKLPRKVVELHRQAFVPRFTFRGRGPLDIGPVFDRIPGSLVD